MRSVVAAQRGLWCAIDAAAHMLEAAGVANARLDAEVLMAEAAGVAREDIVAGVLEPDPQALVRLGVWLRLRERRCPIAYIIGHKEFFSLDLAVTRDVLIPRPETERIVQAALDVLGDHPNRSVLDIGTGSGAIAIAIARNAAAVRIVATDVSEPALCVARENARRHQVADRIEFRRADLFEVLDGGPPLGRFDLIVSNPPYIADAEIDSLEPEIREFEPRLALSAGADGLDFHRRIAAGARAHLEPGGEVMAEMGAGQAAAVAEIFARADLTIASVLDDLAGLPRVACARVGRA